jgi:hypothetical protein
MATCFATSALALDAGQSGGSVVPVDFEIPAQPLGSALIAFGATAGVDIYYNAANAEGRRSAAVEGKLIPTVALQKLLQGTGLVSRMTASDSAILVPAPRDAVVAKGPVAAAGRYEPYFALVQARISDALCRDFANTEDDQEILLRVWLGASGVIDQVEVLGSHTDRTSSRGTNSHGIADVVQGLAVDAPPPGMPQPVTLVVFPPSAARQSCRSLDASRRASRAAN